MRSIRQKITFSMGLTCVVVLILGVALTIWQFKNKVYRHSVIELTHVSRSIPEMIDSLGLELVSVGESLSASDEILNFIRNDDDQALFQHLARFLTLNHLYFAEITDQNGTIILNLVDSLSQGKPSSNPVVPEVISDGTNSHGILRQHDQIYIVATIPIGDKETPLGTLTLGTNFTHELIQRIGGTNGADFAIWEDVDKSAITPIGYDHLPPLSTILNEEELVRILGGKTIIKNIKYPGENLHCAFFTITELGGQRVDICAAYRSLNFLAEATLLTFLHTTTILLLIFILMAQFIRWISNRVTKPLNDLVYSARRIAYTSFCEEIPVSGDDEIGELTTSFNRLVQVFKENYAKKEKLAIELAEINENLEELVVKRTEEIEEANLRLKREIEEKNDFLRTVSHDLGAPLRNIGGLSLMVEKKYGESLGVDGRDRLERIRKNVALELKMIEQLMELSRLKTRRGRNKKLDLNNILTQIKQKFTYSIEEKGIRLVMLDILPTIVADRDRITQLFQNLLDNAIKYMGDQVEPEIQIGWSENPESYLFWVQDNGMGIPEDQRNKVFSVFQRVKRQGIKVSDGMGVGLTTVKTIAEMYRGQAWIESENGQGSTFYFTLDRALVDPNDHGESSQKPGTIEDTYEFCETDINH